MNLKRRIGGKRAKSHGDEFEHAVKRAGEADGFHVIRMPNGCQTIGPNKLMRVKTPFDFIIMKSKKETLFADAKTTEGNTFSHSKITPHQLAELLKIEAIGGTAGYIVFFRQSSEVVWFSAGTLKRLLPGASLKALEGETLGSFHSFGFNRLFVGI